MRGLPSEARTPDSLAHDRRPRSNPTGPRPSRGRLHSRRPSAATLHPGPGHGLGGTWASPRPVLARPPRRSPLTRTRCSPRCRPHGRPAPARGRQPSDTQAEVRPAPLRPTARRAAHRAPRRPSAAAWPISARPAGPAGGGAMLITFSRQLLPPSYQSPAHTGEWRLAQPITAWRRWVYADTVARRKGRQEEGE